MSADVANLPDGLRIYSLLGSRGLEKPPSLALHMQISPPERRVLESPKSVFGETDENFDKIYPAFRASRFVESVGTYLALLNHALIGPSGLVYVDGGLLYESVFPWQMENLYAQFAKEIDVFLAEPDLPQKIPTTSRHKDLFHAREGGDVGYFHFINSILPRLAIYNRIASPRLPVLVYHSRPFSGELVALLGIENAIQPQGWARAERLYFPSPMTFHGDHFTRPKFGSTLIRELTDPIVKKRNAGRRVYLGRSDVEVRRLTNEEELRRILSRYDFEVVVINDMSMRDQIDLFGEIDCLVSPHGAGLSNMVFMPDDARIVEIISPSRLWPTFRTAASRHGLEYHAVIGKDVEVDQTATKGVGNEDFRCDPRALTRSLSQIFL